jgi:hypothetical protein
MLLAAGFAVFAQGGSQGNNEQPRLAPPAVAAVTEPGKPRKPRLTLKPAAGFYYPTSGKTRSTFGSTWTMVGLTIDYRDEDRSKSRFQFEIDGIRRKSGTDLAVIFPIGFKYTERLNASRTFSPYFGGTLGWCIADVRSVADGVDTGLRSAGVGGSGFVGANVGMNIKLEAAYHVFPNIKGFNLSGFSIGAQLQF